MLGEITLAGESKAEGAFAGARSVSGDSGCLIFPDCRVNRGTALAYTGGTVYDSRACNLPIFIACTGHSRQKPCIYFLILCLIGECQQTCRLQHLTACFLTKKKQVNLGLGSPKTLSINDFEPIADLTELATHPCS